ncbi:unnamed protein product, partial [Symbiodinium microadriaticum]
AGAEEIDQAELARLSAEQGRLSEMTLNLIKNTEEEMRMTMKFNGFVAPVFLGMIFSLLVLAMPVSAQEPADDGAGMSSLDEELFNDLGSDLFDDIDLPEDAKTAPDDSKPPTEQGLQPDPSADSDGGPRGFGADQTEQMQSEDPLSKIGGLMRQVQQRIADGQAESRTVAMQQEIIEEIEKLLEQQ